MDELGSLWSYQENFDELNHKLLYTTAELETLKMEASEASRKHKEEVKHLLNLLKVAYQERDEAKDQLQKLLNKFMPSSPTEFHPNILGHLSHESPLVVVPTKANSSITESNSHSDTYNPQSHGSSPVDSFFDAVSSPDFSNINMADSRNLNFVNQSIVNDYNGPVPTLVSSVVTKIDPATAVLDSLVKGKTLPQKGKLLQSVMEAGPLLQTLLVAGPLPRWRNPPPLQSFKIPPFSIKGFETLGINQKPADKLSCVAERSLNSSSSYLQMPRPSSQTCSTSMLSFSTCPAAAAVQSNGILLTAGASINTQIPPSKRQRFQY